MYGNRHIWIVEASSFPFKKWNPVIKFGDGCHTGYLAYGMHYSRKNARDAAKYMKFHNSYNRFIETVKYRVKLYLRNG